MQLSLKHAQLSAQRPSRSHRASRHTVRPVAAAAAVEQATKLNAADRVQLADSDLNVSVCCLGTMTWGVQNTEEDAHKQLSYAWDQGINFMDTAEMYPIPTTADTQGRTDRYIGTWLKKRNRTDVVLATKVAGSSERITWLREGGRTPRVTQEDIVYSVDQSLKRLQTDHIDLLQIHWPDRYVPLFGDKQYDPSKERQDDVPFEEQLLGLQKVIQAGKVRYVGVSNETSWGVTQFTHLAKQAGLPKISTIQNGYSLINRGAFETDLAETCRRERVSLLAYSPLAGGALSGKYVKGTPANSRLTLFEGYMARYNQSLAKEAVAEYIKVAEKHGLTPTELALAWCRSRWFVTSTIIGATSTEQLKENLGAFSIELSQEVHKDVEAVFKRYRDPAFN